MGFKLTTLVVLGTDWTGSFKSKNHMITTMTTTVQYIILSHENKKKKKKTPKNTNKNFKYKLMKEFPIIWIVKMFIHKQVFKIILTDA